MLLFFNRNKQINKQTIKQKNPSAVLSESGGWSSAEPDFWQHCTVFSYRWYRLTSKCLILLLAMK